jgi:hypothetical protein
MSPVRKVADVMLFPNLISIKMSEPRHGFRRERRQLRNKDQITFNYMRGDQQ